MDCTVYQIFVLLSYVISKLYTVFQCLGEESQSYGYGGTGKFSVNCKFSDYGMMFGEGDVIGAMLDLESQPPSISYMKNGSWLGVAAPLYGYGVGDSSAALFPHILTKNCRFDCFAEREQC